MNVIQIRTYAIKIAVIVSFKAQWRPKKYFLFLSILIVTYFKFGYYMFFFFCIIKSTFRFYSYINLISLVYSRVYYILQSLVYSGVYIPHKKWKNIYSSLYFTFVTPLHITPTPSRVSRTEYINPWMSFWTSQ